jgi:DNA repair protein RadC
MGSEALWVILLAESGQEVARVGLPRPPDRDQLPLRELAAEGLRHDAAAMILVRDADDAACRPCPVEMTMIETARRTLSVIGLRLFDYILWYGEHCASLRESGWL